MVKNPLWIVLVMIAQGLAVNAQNFILLDSIVADEEIPLYEFKMNIPIGQTFVNRAKGNSFHYIRAIMPDNKVLPIIRTETLEDRVSTFFSWEPGTNARRAGTQISNSNQQAVYSYKFSNTTSINEAEKYIWELNPVRGFPISLDLNLGYGSSRLDFSGLSLRKININSGAADVIITYSSPNVVPLESMDITSGMSKIVIRNVELARAETIHIKNGMGNTKIILGDRHVSASQIHIEVGAGSCVIITQQKVPVRLIINDSFLSKKEIPENFIRASENIYVNHAFKKNSVDATTFYIDLSLGRLSLITIGE